MRILVSTPYLGGLGGIERHVASTIRALGPHHEIDVCARRVIDSEYLVRPMNGRVVSRVRWRRPRAGRRVLAAVWPVVEPIVRYRPRPYDVYLHYQWADDVRPRFQARTSIVIPCGDDVRHLEATFDVVALEAPDNDRWVEDKSKVVLLPPALDKTATTAQPIAGLPEDFFLTVFNPYHPRKGFEDLRTCAPHSRLPIVWCRSSATRVLTTPSQLENVIVLENVSQANLRYLYEHCRAYVEFGRNIGFGWSLADALQYGAPVLSRWRGVLSIPGLDVRGVYSFTELDELTNLLGRVHYERVSRDTSELSPVRFLERFERVVMRDDTQRSAGRVGD